MYPTTRFNDQRSGMNLPRVWVQCSVLQKQCLKISGTMLERKNDVGGLFAGECSQVTSRNNLPRSSVQCSALSKQSPKTSGTTFFVIEKNGEGVFARDPRPLDTIMEAQGAMSQDRWYNSP